jgi:hypothetical protein
VSKQSEQLPTLPPITIPAALLTIMNSQLTFAPLSSSVPTPPEMITASLMNVSFDDSSFDASSFAAQSSLSSSYDSYSSQESASSCISKSKVGGLSRSRCMSNLSALGGQSSETSIPRQASYKSGPNHQGWGYFVDTPRT